MYKIQFIGSLNQSAEFASKWREKLYPEQVAKGKLLSKEIAKNKDNFWGDRQIIAEQNNLTKQKLKKEARQSRTNRNINKDSEVSENLDNKIYKSNKTSLSAKGQQKLKELKSAYKKRKFTANIGKAKNFIGKNKLGIGAIGLATAGVLGYGLIKKMRSDKGKKRGFYK